MMISLMLSDMPCECIISLSPSTLSLSPSSELPSDVPAPSPEQQQAIVQRLYTASAMRLMMIVMTTVLHLSHLHGQTVSVC